MGLQRVRHDLATEQQPGQATLCLLGLYPCGRETVQREFRKTDLNGSFPGGSVGKNPPARVGVVGLICGSGRSPGEEVATHSSILAWEIVWTVELGDYSLWGCKEV